MLGKRYPNAQFVVTGARQMIEKRQASTAVLRAAVA
jgi:hypothetical protein